MHVQTDGGKHNDSEDEEDEKEMNADGFEVTGLEQFIRKVGPMVFEAIKQNEKEDLLDGLKQIFTEITDGSGSSELQQLNFSSGSDLRSKLEQPFDFAKANSANKINNQNSKAAKKIEDDFDDGFNEPRFGDSKAAQIKMSDDDAFAVTFLDWNCNAQ